MEYKEMPSQGANLAMVIIGFFLGILWGALSVKPYQNLKAAIAAGDAETAEANAKKIRTYFIIGVVVNVLIFVGKMAGGM
jgi:hypothetical protein